MAKRVITILGARPQFIKASSTSRALSEVGIAEEIVHTGQHYDDEMSQIFFDQLGIPAPSINLSLGGGNHGAMTGRMLEAIEKVILHSDPGAVLVYGDTNSTLAGALAAVKLHIPVVHVEAGLRSFNRKMPEEINRILTDHASDLLLCTSETAVKNLNHEGITGQVHEVGDVMRDSYLHAVSLGEAATAWPRGLAEIFRVQPFYLMTLHRAETTDAEGCLEKMIALTAQLTNPVVLPLHPRTKDTLKTRGLQFSDNVVVIDPVGYLEMVSLLTSCCGVLTDSGGLQKEAYWAGKDCATLRSETEWVETVDLGWNTVVGYDVDRALAAVADWPRRENISDPDVYGDGNASARIAELVGQLLKG